MDRNGLGVRAMEIGMDWDILAMDLDIIMERILILLSLWVGSLHLIIRYLFTYTVIFNR